MSVLLNVGGKVFTHPLLASPIAPLKALAAEATYPDASKMYEVCYQSIPRTVHACPKGMAVRAELPIVDPLDTPGVGGVGVRNEHAQAVEQQGPAPVVQWDSKAGAIIGT